MFLILIRLREAQRIVQFYTFEGTTMLGLVIIGLGLDMVQI